MLVRKHDSRGDTVIFPDSWNDQQKVWATCIIIGASILCIGFVVAIASDEPEDTSDRSIDMEPSDSEYVNRFVDRDAGVVCYVFDREGAAASGAGWKNGISCLPLNQTRLS